MEPVGRHALVTGGGRGIGAAIARALTDAGASVTILGRSPDALRDAIASGAAARFVVGDVTDAASLAAALGSLGPIDILVNNAGAAESAPFRKLERGQWDRMIAVNLTSVYETTQAVLGGMIGRGWGRVVNIASTAGLRGYPYVAAYVAAKHGVVGLTRALALETARTGVTINAVCPGYTETELIARAVRKVVDATGRSEDQARADFARANPQGRLVTPEEVAQAVLFLCGPASDAMTGQAIAVAGGEVM
jgi:NAD(P)-dependent dehydrogenase (short-subunit alcohol dehydrogenase family)